MNEPLHDYLMALRDRALLSRPALLASMGMSPSPARCAMRRNHRLPVGGAVYVEGVGYCCQACALDDRSL